ncbi:MAG: sugar O-acetyltransferase [Clostridia bacterium]
MTQEERMEKGLIYLPTGDSIMREQIKCLEKLYDFNATRPSELAKREAMLKDMFCALGEGCYIEPPLRSNWGGKHVSFGNFVYANFNLTLVDDGNIIVGNNVMFAPNVIVATAGHPVEPSLREKGCQFNKDVVIGDNVWIGAGVIILPGVKVGNNVVIGAGSVVTKDIEDNVVAVGNPCKVMRFIGERDKKYFYKKELIDWANLE